MKQLHIYISLLLACVLSALVSCADNENDEIAAKDLIELIVNKPVVRIGQSEEVTVRIIVSNGSCVVNSYNTDIATATVSGDVVTIRSGAKNGATTVELVDEEGVKADISVNVGLFDLEVNEQSFEIEVGDDDELIVSMGNFSSNDDLTIETTSGEEIISVVNTDALRPYYTIKGLKIGEEDIVITDKKGKQTTVHVSVTPLNIEVTDESPKVGVNDKTQVTIERGNGGYTCEPASDEDADKIEIVPVGENRFTIVGKSEGTASVVITDQAGKTLTLPVTVVKADKVAYLGSSTYFSVPFEYDGAVDETLKSMNSITYEARINISSLNGDSDAKINTVMGVEGIFLMRVDVHKGGNSTDRYLQLAADKKGGVRYEGSTKIETNRWYNVAIVLDGSKSGTDRIAIYVDGVKETLQLSNGTPDDLKEVNLTSNFYIARSDGKRSLNGAITYARIWNKALSETEIASQSGKLLGTSETDGLVANWNFTNVNGNVSTFTSYEAKVFQAKASATVSTWITDDILK